LQKPLPQLFSYEYMSNGDWLVPALVAISQHAFYIVLTERYYAVTQPLAPPRRRGTLRYLHNC
jgi:hypothetical protein